MSIASITARMKQADYQANRRSSSGRMISDMDQASSEAGSSSEYSRKYTVHIPLTPDNQPMATGSIAVENLPDRNSISTTIFSGGFNSKTESHSTELAMIGSNKAEGSFCSIQGCDGKLMTDKLGSNLLPCECSFRICRDCYEDAVSHGGKCPGCKEQYRELDADTGPEQQPQMLSLPQPPAMAAKLDHRLSVRSSSLVALSQNQTSNFDHADWLYQTKGTYGYGNAVWPKDGGGLEGHGGAPSFDDTAGRPLSRKVNASIAILSPYRFLVVIRMAVLGLFLAWRVRHSNKDAMWLWGMSVVCEIWFAFSWILDQLPKLFPVNRVTDLAVLKNKFEMPTPENPSGRSDLPGFDVFVSTADPEKEPPLVTANTILSILAVEYPVEKLSCYLSDDGGALFTFEALSEAASFAKIWVPFCRKHQIEPRNPETYFTLKGDPTKNKVRPDFVKDRRRVKREYDEFKVRINGMPDAIRRRSEAYTAHEELTAMKSTLEKGGNASEILNIPKAAWMADGTHWPGTWTVAHKDHSRGDHAGIIQVMLAPPSNDPMFGSSDEDMIDTSEVDVRLPMLVYVSREKRPGYDHNKKAGAMNALVRSSAIMSNGAFILNVDCDHYIFNSLALREAMCFMMDRGGDRLAYVQFPQRFEGIDPNDRYANHNTVFFDVNMRALDGIQGPVYVGTGCVFRRTALYGFDPPRFKSRGCCGGKRKPKKPHPKESLTRESSLRVTPVDDEDEADALLLLPKQFGNSSAFVASIPVAEFQGLPLADKGVAGRPAGALIAPRPPLDADAVAEAIRVISSWYEEKTEWGDRVGWIYGSVTEDVVTGYRMHNRGWRSVYCVTKRDAFRGSAPINLTDRLHQVLRWATGSVEIFFSRNNAVLSSSRMKLLQKVAYLNVGIYPFTSIFLLVYCFLPALSLFSNQFIVQTLNVTFLVYLLAITVSLFLLAILEVRWSGITLDEWWRNEQFWVIGGTSAHLAAVLQGLLKVAAGVDISFTLTSKSGGDGEDDEYADLYVIKWTALMILPITIMLTNLIAIAVGVSRTIYSEIPEWSKLVGGVFFSFWVLAHLYPFAKGLMGRRGRAPTVVFVWAGLLAIIISLLWIAISPPSGNTSIGGGFQFP